MNQGAIISMEVCSLLTQLIDTCMALFSLISCGEALHRQKPLIFHRNISMLDFQLELTYSRGVSLVMALNRIYTTCIHFLVGLVFL